MKLKDIRKIIKSNIYRYGTPCTIELKNGKVISTALITRRLWKNNKTRLEPSSGIVDSKTYIYDEKGQRTIIKLCVPLDLQEVSYVDE